MAKGASGRSANGAVVPSISSLLGSAPVLPGESAAAYRRGVQASALELGAQTPLQFYLAEKIFECLWWMRRYEGNKHATLVREMAGLLEQGTEPAHARRREVLVNMILSGPGGPGVLAEIERRGYSPESLRQRALASCRHHLLYLDEQIALKAKTLAGLQASYEVLSNRGLNAERMRLQNALLRRDLGALDAPDPVRG